MSLSLPIYKRGSKYVLHLRIADQQIKRTLDTSDPAVARVRGIQLMNQLLGVLLPQSQAQTRRGRVIDLWAAGSKRQITHPGAAQADAVGPDAPARLETAQGPKGSSQYGVAQEEASLPVEPGIGQQELIRYTQHLPTVFVPRTALPDRDKFKLAVVFSNYAAVKKIKAVTKLDYSKYSKDIVPFFKNRDIRTLTESDVSELILHLRTKLGNDPRTIDNKVGFLRAVINHLIKQKQFAGANPAAGKNLVSKRERRQSGTKPIAYNDLREIFGVQAFAALRHSKPSIYLIVMVGLCTGMRVSSVARLESKDLKESMKQTPYIDISGDKTVAGNRDIPIPRTLFDALKSHLKENDGFGLTARESGKGYSDAVNKPIRAYLKANHMDGMHEKLSYHAFRKSFNNHMLRLGVEGYICGAILGHVDESMTTGIYAIPPSVDVLAQRIGQHQEEILGYLGFHW